MAFSGRKGEHTFFIYDHTLLKKEEDDLKDAIIYFYPETVSPDDQCALCGQIMGMCEFLKATLAQAPPNMYKFEHTKFALKRIGAYSLAMESGIFTPDSIVHCQLTDLYETFVTFHGSLDSLKLRLSDTKSGFVLELASIWRTLISVTKATSKPHLTLTLQGLPYLPLPKTACHLFQEASNLLQACQRRPYVLAGAIFYKNQVLYTQLPSRLTRHLTFLQNELPHIGKKTDCDLPKGCKLVTLFLTDHELQDIIPLDPLARRHCKSTDFSMRRDIETHPTRKQPSHTKHMVRSYTCPELHIRLDQSAHLQEIHKQALAQTDSAANANNAADNSNEGRSSHGSIRVEQLPWKKDISRASLSEITIKESASDRESDHGESHMELHGENCYKENGRKFSSQQGIGARLEDDATDTDYTTDNISPVTVSQHTAANPHMETLRLDLCQENQLIGGNGDVSHLGNESSKVGMIDKTLKTIVENAQSDEHKCGKEDIAKGSDKTAVETTKSEDVHKSQGEVKYTDLSGNSANRLTDISKDSASRLSTDGVMDEKVRKETKMFDLNDQSLDASVAETIPNEDNSDDEVFQSVNGSPQPSPEKSLEVSTSSSYGARKNAGVHKVSFTEDLEHRAHKLISPTSAPESDLEDSETVVKSFLAESELETEYEDFESRHFKSCIKCLSTEKLQPTESQIGLCEKCKETAENDEQGDKDKVCRSVKGKALEEYEHNQETFKQGQVNIPKHVGNIALLNTLDTFMGEVTNIDRSKISKGKQTIQSENTNLKNKQERSPGGSTSLNSDMTSSGSSMSQYWSQGMMGLNDVTLYIQSHSDISLMLVMERPEQYEDNVLHSLWKDCVNVMAELDYLIKEILDNEAQDKTTKDPYKFVKFDRYSSAIDGTLDELSEEVSDRKHAQLHRMLDVLHSEFDQRQCMTDITLRSQFSCCYGHQTTVDETFFMPIGDQRLQSGLPSMRDGAFALETVARHRLPKDKHISLL